MIITCELCHCETTELRKITADFVLTVAEPNYSGDITPLPIWILHNTVVCNDCREAIYNLLDSLRHKHPIQIKGTKDER